MSARCDFSDLLASECGCIHCRPDLTPTKAALTVSHTFVAHYSGKCAGCGDRFRDGEQIGRTVDGDYVCGGCIQ